MEAVLTSNVDWHMEYNGVRLRLSINSLNECNFLKLLGYSPLHCTDKVASSTHAFPFQTVQSVQDCGQSPVHILLCINPVVVPLFSSGET